MGVYGDNPTVGNGYKCIDDTTDRYLDYLTDRAKKDSKMKKTESDKLFIAMVEQGTMCLENAYGLAHDVDGALEELDEEDLETTILYEVKIIAKHRVSAAKKYKLTKVK